MKFQLKKEHLQLLGHASVEWCDAEAGAPAIHCKRPYGNSGYVADVLEIIGVEEQRCRHCGERLDDSSQALAETLHRETEKALAIVLSCVGRGEMPAPGTYELRDEYRRSGGWFRVQTAEGKGD